jgi:phosphoglycerate dehydrogenase-like enzyme
MPVIFGLLLGLTLTSASRAEAPPAPAADVATLIERLGLVEDAQPVRERKGWKAPKAVIVRNAMPEALPSLQQVAPGVKLLLAVTEAEAVKLAPEADAVLGFCSSALLAAGPGIRWIQTYSAGVEACVALPELRTHDVLVTNMQRVAGPVMAEHVLAMMLAFARGLDVYVPQRIARRWSEGLPGGREMLALEGKTVLVVGLGGIGTEVARRADALGMHVDAIRASGREGPPFVRQVGLPSDLPALAAKADFIVNSTPLTPETRHLFDAKFFAGVKPGAYFFNVGRGQSVVQDALVEALKSGRLAGAGLDVTDPEPLPADHALWGLSNVIITPHVSAQSDLGQAARAAILRENLRRYVAGDPMLSIVNLDKGY